MNTQDDSMRILLVEDETDAAAILAKGLREQSYAVDIAADGNEALEKARQLAKLIPCENGSLPNCRFRRSPYSLKAAGR